MQVNPETHQSTIRRIEEHRRSEKSLKITGKLILVSLVGPAGDPGTNEYVLIQLTWLLLLITALGASWDFLDQRFAAIDGYRRRVWGDEVSREGARLGEQGVVMRIVGHKEEMWLVLWPRNGLEMLVSCLGMKEVHHQVPVPRTIGCSCQTRDLRECLKPNEPPPPIRSHTRIGESSMEHTFELMDTVPPTPHDSPLTGGYTLGSDEGRLKLKELMAICIKLSKQNEVKHLTPKDGGYNAGLSLSVIDDWMRRNASQGGKVTRQSPMFQVSDIDMKEEKAKEKRVAIKDVEDSPRPIRSITTLQPLPTIDPKDKGKGVLVEEEPKKPVKVKKMGSMLLVLALAKEFDEIQARIDGDHELAKKEIIGSRKSRGNKEQTTYKNSSQEQDDYLPQTYGNDGAINVESLATKYPIVDWKTHILNENMMYYQIIRENGSSKNYKIFSEMLNDFDRQDVIDLHRLVNERYETTSPEGYDLLLWGYLKILFEPNEEDEIWNESQDYN
ncbi:hypothetical protein Tco_0659132 [Tanacetum coccineum]